MHRHPVHLREMENMTCLLWSAGIIVRFPINTQKSST